LEVLIKISKQRLLVHQRRESKMSNLEVIALGLTAEYTGIDSENHLFKKIPEHMSNKIERSVYNKRRRRLADHLEDLRLKLVGHFNGFEDCLNN